MHRKSSGIGERKAVEQVLAGTKVQPEILADFVFEYVSDTKTPQGILLPGASETIQHH